MNKAIGALPHSSVVRNQAFRNLIREHENMMEDEHIDDVDLDGRDVSDDDVGMRDENAFVELINSYYGPQHPGDQIEESFGSRMEGIDHKHREREGIEDAARVPLYEGAKVSRLSATLLILNLQSMAGGTNVHTDGIFKLLSGTLLPSPNTCPTSRLEAKSLMTSIGLEYKVIHACPKGCVLFRKDLEEASFCPKCNSKRYRDDTIGAKVPEKVCLYKCTFDMMKFKHA